MALLINDKFAPRANPGDTNYPDGSIKNESVPGAKDGTPLDADWGNDYAGGDAALFAEVGITPSGDADTALNSQRLDALKLLPVNDLSQSYTVKTVDELRLLSGMPIGKKVFWQGYYTQSDGGSNWGIVKSGTHTEDGGSIFTLADGKYVEANLKNKVLSSKFGIKSDDSDETIQFERWLDYCLDNGVIADGRSLPIRNTLVKTYSPSLDVKLHNLSIIAGNDYTDQTRIVIDTGVSYDIKNLTVDGERDTRPAGTENWQVFTTEQGVNSITPISSFPFSFGGYGSKKITIDGVVGKNLVADGVFSYTSFGTVNLSNLDFKNCGNKTLYGLHGIDGGSQPDTGVTNLDGYSSRDCGIMPATFLVDDILRNRTDNYAPQGSFGCLVSYGTFNHTNIFVKNYGSTGITPDRNLSANGSNIVIKHDDINAFSNNPSGAYWNELCNSCNVDNIDISVSARDPRETVTENSLLQIYVNTGGDCNLTNVKLETSASANIDKDIRGSLQPGSSLKINGIDMESNASLESISMLQVSGRSSLISIKSGRVRGAPIHLTQSDNFTLSDLDTDQAILIDKSLDAPIGNVTLKNVTGSQLDINGSTGKVTVNGGNLTAGLNIASSGLSEVRLDGGLQVGGITFIDNVRSVNVGNIETDRRLEIGNAERVKVVGPVLKTDAGEPICWINPTTPGIMLQATVQSVSCWTKTGTVGAGNVVFGANVGITRETDTDAQTFDWT